MKTVALERFFGSKKKARNALYKGQSLLAFFHTGHSMGCYRKLVIKTQRSKVVITNNDINEYSKSCKWKAKHGELTIVLTRQEFEQITCLHGVWTIKGEGSKCTWLQSIGNKHLYEVIKVEGYLVGESHATRYWEAVRLNILHQRAKIKERQNNNKFVDVNDFYKVGACEPGINAFCERHNIKKYSIYTVGFLKHKDPNNQFIRKVASL